MDLSRYPFQKDTERYYYEFISTGPKGAIRKLVCFRLTDSNIFQTFNLSFGDAEYDSDMIDDLAVTDNKDMNKVLNTVSLVVLEFLRHRSEIAITVYGSTPSRNRLYQIWIAKFLNDINQFFAVFGCVKNSWLPFKAGINYDGFLFIFEKNAIDYGKFKMG